MTLEIFIPFYGQIGYLEEAINSVLAQSSPDWRVIVIDDAYPENNAQSLVSNYADSRISFIRNKKNRGVSGTFQQAIDLSQTEYLTIMGFDDRLRPNYVHSINAIISSNPGVGYIQPGVAVIDEFGDEYLPLGDIVKKLIARKFSPPTLISGEQIAASLLRGNWTYFPSICWNREKISKFGFRQDMQIALDLSLQLNLIAQGENIYLDDIITFEYRRHKKSASAWTAVDGTRFLEEKKLFNENSLRFSSMGWSKASRCSKWHLTSRANAFVQFPAAVIRRNWASCWLLVKHAFLP